MCSLSLSTTTKKKSVRSAPRNLAAARAIIAMLRRAGQALRDADYGCGCCSYDGSAREAREEWDRLRHH